MTDDVVEMRRLASEIAMLERRYRAFDRRMARASARWDRGEYERAEAAQRALGTSEAATLPLWRLMRTWGLSSAADLRTVGVSDRNIAEVERALEGWEIVAMSIEGVRRSLKEMESLRASTGRSR